MTLPAQQVGENRGLIGATVNAHPPRWAADGIGRGDDLAALLQASQTTGSYRLSSSSLGPSATRPSAISCTGI
jgi:hypothetical protein